VVTAGAGHRYSASERLQGRGLAAALVKVRDASGGPIAGDVYIDLNGETWRAAELGGALATLGQGALGVHRIHAPAASVGDTGAASGALAIACASQAFARGYSSGPKSWVISSADQGQISVACVESPAHG
jgi:3-oxoacyl-[acyl-carrier-protein] synthase-1